MSTASPWHSIQWKLPIMMGGVLLLVVGALTLLFYRSLEQSLLASAENRLESAAGVLGGALRPQLEGRATAVERLAALPEMAALLEDPEGASAAAVAAVTAATPPTGATAGTASLEVRGPGGACVGTFARGTHAWTPGGCLDFGDVAVAAPQALPIRAIADTARLGVAAPIPGPAGGAPAGWLLERRPFNSAAAGLQLIEGLIGSDARIYLANADGSVWTDLTKLVPAPHDAAPSDRLIRYRADGEERLAMTRPLEGTPLVLSVEFPRASVLAPANSFVRRALLAALVLLVIGCVATWLVSHHMVLPLREATHVAEEVAAGNYHTRIAVHRADEIGRLGTAFNVMADEVQRSQAELEARVERRTEQLHETLEQLRGAQDELVRKEKLAMLGQLSSSVGHELRNPLGVMSNAVYFLKVVLKDAPPKVAEYLEILKHQIVLSEKIVSDLLDFARVKPPQTEMVSVAELVKGQLERVGESDGIQVVTAMADGLPPVVVDRVQIGQVLFNLLTNAVQAMESGGVLKVSAVPNGSDTVRVDVSDTGSGIEPDRVQKIFDPLFTTKARGIGLGLSVARSLARANRGDIAVSSEPGHGSTFTLTLPTMQSSAAA